MDKLWIVKVLHGRNRIVFLVEGIQQVGLVFKQAETEELPILPLRGKVLNTCKADNIRTENQKK